MNRSPEAQVYSMSKETCFLIASVQGAGAAAPTIPTTTLSVSSSIQPMAATDNFASGVAGDITRSGAGAYTIKLKDALPVILNMIPVVWGTDGKLCQIVDYVPNTRVVSVQVRSAAGAAADLASTDNLKILVIGKLTV